MVTVCRDGTGGLAGLHPDRLYGKCADRAAPGMGSNSLSPTRWYWARACLAGSLGASVLERRLLSAAYRYRHSQDPADAYPSDLKRALTAGIGLFIMFVG